MCFGQETWSRLKEAVRGASSGKGRSSRRKRAHPRGYPADRAPVVQQGWGESPVVEFSFDCREDKAWWEAENWAMVTDPENAFADLRREEGLKLKELLKGNTAKFGRVRG